MKTLNELKSEVLALMDSMNQKGPFSPQKILFHLKSREVITTSEEWHMVDDLIGGMVQAGELTRAYSTPFGRYYVLTDKIPF